MLSFAWSSIYMSVTELKDNTGCCLPWSQPTSYLSLRFFLPLSPALFQTHSPSFLAYGVIVLIIESMDR